MKTVKKSVSLALALLLALSLLTLSACGGKNNNQSSDPPPADDVQTPAEDEAPAETPSGVAAITDGYYATEISGLPSFYHFSEDGTYYGYFFDGGVTDAGTYEVLDKSMDYYETYDGDTPDESSKKTAPQVVSVTSYKDGSLLEIPFDGDRLCDFTAGGMSGHVFMDHDPAFAYSADDMEPSIAVQTLYANNDAGMTLTLYHNRTFVDYTGDKRIGGTWDQTADGYTLTAESGESYTLTLTTDGADYGKGSETVALNSKLLAGEVVAEFAPEAAVPVSGVPGMEGPSDCEVKLLVYGNDTMELIADIFGNQVIVDKGTYAMDDSAMIPAYTFTFESAGEILSEPDYGSATENSINLGLTYTVTDVACSVDMGGNVMDLALSLETAMTYTFVMG